MKLNFLRSWYIEDYAIKISESDLLQNDSKNSRGGMNWVLKLFRQIFLKTFFESLIEAINEEINEIDEDIRNSHSFSSHKQD